MLIEQNYCVGCDIPCVNCGLKHALHRVCDGCKAEEPLYKFEGGEYCIDCISEMCPEAAFEDECDECGNVGKLYHYHEEKRICIDCIAEKLEKVK